ncbi:MAG: hypothetical protein K8R23_01935 [Chthoniobacter sp.]|nr:hypothetical protein [Chthoniobacter sp.]
MSEPPEPTASSPWTERRVRWLCTALGAWGVATGFAVFILLWTHGRPHPLTFLAGLLVAAVIAYVAEWLRELIREGVAVPAITGPRVIVTVLLLMIIELVVHAGTALVQIGGDHHEAAAVHSELQEILAPVAGAGSGQIVEVVGLMLAWMLVGAVVARRLSRVVFLRLPGTAGGVMRGAREGVLGGLVAAPVGAIACLLLLRGIKQVTAMITRGDAWAQELRSSLAYLHLESGWMVLLKLPTYLWLGAYHVGKLGHGAGWVVLAVLAVGAGVYGWRWRARRWVRWAGLGLALALLAPMPTDLGRMFEIALLAIVIWIVPGFLLGAAGPLLRGAGDEPRLWSLIAFGAAGLLCLLTWLKFASPWCYALAFGLVLIGLLFFRGASLREYWPLAAAAMASMVSGVMVFVEKATFLGVFSEVHAIHQLANVRPNPLLANMNALIEIFRPDEQFDSEDMRKLSRQVRELAKLPGDRRAERLKEIAGLLAQIQTRTRSAEAEHLREFASGRMWGVFSPGDDVAELYRATAALVENPPTKNQREAVFGGLLARVDGLIGTEKEAAAAQWQRRAKVTNTQKEMEAALQTGKASEDTARFGPALGLLAAELWEFSTRPPDTRAEQGSTLRRRLGALLRANDVSVPGGEADPFAQFSLPSLEPQPLKDRLTKMWEQLERELKTPGSGGFLPPQPFTGDPAVLPWRSVPQPGSAVGGLRSRLDWLEGARADIERHRLALAAEQEPPTPPPAATGGHAPAAGHGEGTSATDAHHQPEPASKEAIHESPSLGMIAMFPAAARAARLAEIQRQLVAVQRSAEETKESWTAAPAVTLELSLVGSFGFWVTVALLASWSLTDLRRHHGGHGA